MCIAVKGYMALRKAGYPIYFSNFKEIYRELKQKYIQS